MTSAMQQQQQLQTRLMLKMRRRGWPIKTITTRDCKSKKKADDA